jgi:hypothetical protein
VGLSMPVVVDERCRLHDAAADAHADDARV